MAHPESDHRIKIEHVKLQFTICEQFCNRDHRYCMLHAFVGDTVCVALRFIIIIAIKYEVLIKQKNTHACRSKESGMKIKIRKRQLYCEMNFHFGRFEL